MLRGVFNRIHCTSERYKSITRIILPILQILSMEENEEKGRIL